MFILLPTPPYSTPLKLQTWLTLVYPLDLNLDITASWKPSLMRMDYVRGPIVPPSLLVSHVTLLKYLQ